ncbi:UDP-N-acetylmuramoyl-L-alanyl-D-glutamate--2,6-diaminopimelate ligase [Desulfurispora thermophila]|uniref:UDP-N-acetylmuramoyl-L-alanyl-D-glutamate--2, 6-diaminopimelate ligase n=1 Tax=Desulfurispora thermophila TaxID=265470 RepID=UPI000372F5CD|nr:UDP-N-acetylmuramoyl-L-alanyl-D-glutamate--2,6-diaminopimelate ligase [Desulfurispora thermophila]
MQLREILRDIEPVSCTGSLDVEVSGIYYDSRRVEPGGLFVAIPGLKQDGHDFVPAAVQRGAVAVLGQRTLPLPPGVTQVVVADSRRAQALAAANFYGRPARQLKMVGVTGTNGKTTTTNLVYQIMRRAGWKAGLIGTIHNLIDQQVLPGQHTTPEATDLQSLLARMVGAGVRGVAMEVSSHALALERVAGCAYDVAVFTNLTRDHLDFHRDMEDYLAAKLRLFAGLAQNSGKGAGRAVVNLDDSYAQRVIAAAGPVPVITYALHGSADVQARDIEVTPRGVSFAITGRWPVGRVRLALTGLFNVYNALAAFAAGVALGIDPQTCVQGLESVAGVPGRFELVDRGQDFAVVVDYAHTPDGLENVLRTARQITAGRLITVFGCGGDRDKSKRPIMGRVAAKLSDLPVITSDNPRTEDPLAIIKQVEEGVRQLLPPEKYLVIPDRRQAIRQAIALARSGDTVLIAGKGHEDYQIIGTTKHHFDDREEAAAALQDRMAGRSGK